jgi:hypothetical protein
MFSSAPQKVCDTPEVNLTMGRWIAHIELVDYKGAHGR